MDGDHTIERCAAATEGVLVALVAQLRLQGVVLEHTILKPNMVLSGINARSRPASLCRGRRDRLVFPAHRARGGPRNCFPLPAASPRTSPRAPQRDERPLQEQDAVGADLLLFRAVQQPALDAWAGRDENVPAAQKALYHRAKCNRAARVESIRAQWRSNSARCRR